MKNMKDITTVREANQWLKRVGEHRFKFSTRMDKRLGRVYTLSEKINEKYNTLYESDMLEELIERVHIYGYIPYC